MKVLLLYTRFGGKNLSFVDLSFRVPLGIAYLGSVLRKHGFDVYLRDGLFYSEWEQFREDLEKIMPDVVGLSFTTLRKKEALKYVQIIRDLLPEAKIIAGGPHPTINPAEVLKELNIDFVIYGEGEETLPELLDFIKKNKVVDVHNIKGIGYKLNGEVKINQPRCMILDLDKIPWPARDLLLMEKYLGIAPLMPLPYPSTNIVTSRGCPGNCLFCQPTLKKLTGQKVRYRRVEEVIKEVKFLIKEYHIKSIELGVDEPTYNKEWVEKFCDALIKERIKIKWGTPSRVDTVNKELLRKMAKSGCIYISYGIESGSQKIMNVLRKGTKVEQAKKALKWTEEVGICGRANIMIGSPGETKETINETITFIKKAKPDFIFVAATTPLYGTDLYDLAKKEGLLVETKSGIRGYDIGHLKLKELSNEDLKKSLDEIVNTYKRIILSSLFNPIMLWRKKHLYFSVVRYFFSLLRNWKEFIRALDYYLSYGEQIKVREE